MDMSGILSNMVVQHNVRINKKKWKETMSNKEEPEKLFEIFDQLWDSKEEMVKDITDKLKEFGYSTTENIDQDVINVMCEHEKVCRIVMLTQYEEGDWVFDIRDDDSIKDICQICRIKKTIQYMFDGDALKYWNKDEEFSGPFEEIDLNGFINWDEVNNKAIEEMKERYPKNTIFVDIDE